jgi:MFS family permease
MSTAAPPPRSRLRSIALVGMLGGAMVVATYLQGALSVVSTFVIDEFGLTRSQFGSAFTAFSLTGAVASPYMGALTDRDTPKVMAGLFGLGGLAVLIVATAPNFWVLLAGSVVGGLALGAGNPATNRVIADHIGIARRGLVVGLKQAGPPMGLLIAGVVLPPLALALSWRWAMGITVLIPVAGMVATLVLLSSSRRGESAPPTRMSEENSETRLVVLWLSVIGLGVALSLSAVIAFVPLYAQERLGATAATAGALASLFGLTGVAGRVGWGAIAHRFSRPSNALLVITGVSLLATLAIALAQAVGLWMLWVGVVAGGFSMMAWHAIGWLVIIDRVGVGGVGKASGVMQLGNSVGFASGPLLAGIVIDATESYAVGWALVGGVLVVSGLLTLWIRFRAPRAPYPPTTEPPGPAGDSLS